MKKPLYLILFLTLVYSCGPKQDKVERIIEDGVEVVVNQIEPYRIEKENLLLLEEVFRIDTEDEEILNFGIPDIFGFEVNSEEEIFILRNVTGEGDFVYKFNSNGKFVKSFGPFGEGPGEFQNPHHISVDDKDNILVVDLGPQKLLKYDSDGIFIEDRQMGNENYRFASGPRNKMLAQGMSIEPVNETAVYTFSLKLLDPDFEELHVIDQFSFEVNKKKFRASDPFFCWSSSKDYIYVANENRGYEIWVFDINGKLIRKIRKEYKKIPISEDYKTKILNPMPEFMKEAAFFPEFYSPFQSITAGEDGKLLVFTFEKGKNPGEFMVDIFNEDGVFITRKSLNIYVWEGHLWARIQSDKLYCLEEKETGYKELVVYRMNWE